MTKTQLIAVAARLGLEVSGKEKKEALMESIINAYNEKGDNEGLMEFLDNNGLTVNEEGVIVKKSRRQSLGENPNTKAYHTIKVLQDESLAHLSYSELAAYLKETSGIETTSNSIAWYANWLKSKNQPVVPRQRKKKEGLPEAEEVPTAEEE